MAKWGYFSCDEDTGEVVAKTEQRSDGTVHRYEYTKPDDIRAGHGHSSYKSMDDYLKGETARIPRDKSAPESKGRPWQGNGYDLGINGLEDLSIDDLYALKLSLETEFIHSSAELMAGIIMKEKTSQLVLKR